MKAADAKAPKFDSKWWKANKAKDADAKGAFENALKEYEKAKSTFESAQELNDLAPLGKKLEAVMKAAKIAQADPKLGVMQKETKEGLVNYEKISATALKGLAAAARDADLHSSVTDLVKRQSKALMAFCKSEYSTENFEFLILMSKGVKTREVYDKYVKQGSDKQINVSAPTRKALDAVATQTPAADAAAWKNAPWAAAEKDIVALVKRDTLPRFQKAHLANVLKAVKLP